MTRAPDNELFLIVGGDVAAGLPRWREPERVLSLATLAVAKRRGTARAAVEEALRRLPAASGRSFFRMPRIGISSTHDPPAGRGPGSRSGTSSPTRSPPTSTTPALRRSRQLSMTSRADRRPRSPSYAADRKALDIVALDLRGMIGYADYFVICTGRTDRQMQGDPRRDPRRAEVRPRPAARAGRGPQPRRAGS